MRHWETLVGWQAFRGWCNEISAGNGLKHDPLSACTCPYPRPPKETIPERKDTWFPLGWRDTLRQMRDALADVVAPCCLLPLACNSSLWTGCPAAQLTLLFSPVSRSSNILWHRAASSVATTCAFSSHFESSSRLGLAREARSE